MLPPGQEINRKWIRPQVENAYNPEPLICETLSDKTRPTQERPGGQRAVITEAILSAWLI